MLNAGRLIDFAIFTLDEPVEIGEFKLEPGLQQIFQINGSYHFKKINAKSAYVAVPLTNNIAVLQVLFSKDMFTGM